MVFFDISKKFFLIAQTILLCRKKFYFCNFILKIEHQLWWLHLKSNYSHYNNRIHR